MYFFPASVLFLAAAFYLSYRRGIGPRWHRIVLWIVTGLFALLWSLPYFM